ncbi:MAG: methylmalonyl Co-A mutase-associated GTPase MeaB [Bacteroidota bacterium]
MTSSFRRTSSFDPQVLAKNLLNRDRYSLSKAITLVESKRSEDNGLAVELLEAIAPHTGNSIRIGITGVPGVGKSTFIEAFGCLLTERKKRVAVLSIDPSSSQSKGSILGDKTRMDLLSQNENAFIRPSATGSFLGGVAATTREAIMLCEAAGFEVILIETVGVGQSETMVRDMVDYFLLMVLTGSGDDLQGIKRGIMEMADHLVVHKVDGENKTAANVAKDHLQNALHLFPPNKANWVVPVTLASSTQKTGLVSILESIEAYAELTKENGYFDQNRSEQKRYWFREQIKSKLIQDFYSQPQISELIKKKENLISSEKISVRQALEELFKKENR